MINGKCPLLTLLTINLAFHLNREQQCVIEHLQMENQVLREKLDKGRVMLNDDRRRRLAVKDKALGRRALRELAASNPARTGATV